MADLEFFSISYDALGVSADRNIDVDAEPDVRPMTCNIEFIFRVPPGFAFRCVDFDPRPTDLGLDNFVCRVDEGRLKGLDGTVNFQMPANTALLGWDGDLFIDVAFTNVVYSRGSRIWKNFAFICPTVPDTAVNLTKVTRYPYVPRARYLDYFARNPVPSL